MAAQEVAVGVVVQTPDDIEVKVVQGGPVRRGVRRAAASTAPGTDALKAALQSSDFRIVAEVELVPMRPGTRALRRDHGMPTQIAVDVGVSESALVLVEGAGGVYAWTYPQLTYPSGRRGRSRTLVFPLAGSAGPAGARAAPDTGGKRGPVLDWIADKLIEPVRAYGLKFATRTALDAAVDYIEGDKTEGLILMESPDPGSWTVGSIPLRQFPQDRPARILLMVHGTFSSTAGGFAQLASTEVGRKFLTAARGSYDAVLGFDHKTLVAGPDENAAALLAALQGLTLPQGSLIDAVAHSRGGLVYRILAEQLLAAARPDIKLGSAIFVGCTNAGTHLAEPENWAAMVDLYTNAIMAGVRTVTYLAGGAAITPLLSMGIKTLGRFVQGLSEVAISDGRVPGLAGMQPDGKIIKELNTSSGALDRLAVYYAITSNFVAQIEPNKGLTKEFVEFILDRVTNRLFKLDNDLVVDTASMISLGTRQPRLAERNVVAFGDTDDVYHTIYFLSEMVPVKLGEWLGLSVAEQPTRVSARPAGPNADWRRVAPAPIEGSRLEAPFGADRSVAAEPDRSERTLRRPSRRAAPPSFSRTPASAAPAEPAEMAPSPPAPAAPVPAEAGVDCYFAAEMEPHPPLKKQVPLFVTVSRQRIDIAESPASATLNTPVNVDARRKIVVEVIARRNCRVLGDASAEIDIPDHPRPETMRFVIEGAAEGSADILVEARQGPRILASFSLMPVFVALEKSTLRKTQFASALPDQRDQPAVLRIYEIVEGGRVTLRFDLACLDPNISVSESRTFPASFSREVYVAEIFRGIESAWLTTNRLYDQFLSRLQANGIIMANELLPDKVREALWRHRNAIRAIQVISEEPFIPWELLYINDRKAGPEGKGFLSEWGLVRWLHSTPWPGPRIAMRSDRVFYVIPDYLDPGMKLAGADAERKMLGTLFGKAREVVAESLSVTQFLQKEARACDVLHFACHGEAAQRAVMTADLLMTGTKVDDGVAPDPLSADQVKAFARFADSGPNPIVFINACQTGRTGSSISGGVAGFIDAFLRPFSEQGAGALVGALWSVDDKLAYSFAESFYNALKDGEPLVEAARTARQVSKDRRELTWLAYSVYGNPFACAADPFP